MRRTAPWFAGALGALLIVAGVFVFAAANRAAGEFGWFSGGYVPLEPGDPVPYSSTFHLTYFESGWDVRWTGTHLIGAGLVVLGALVLAALGGWLAGRRVRRS